MKTHLLSIFVFLLYRLLMLTWRIRIHESDSLKAQLKQNKGFVVAAWHGNELGLLPICTRYKMAALVSQSKDGQLMSNLLRMLGTKTARGSSSKGAISGLKSLIRILIKEGRSASFAVDGPRGPYRKIKPGVFEVSKLAKLPIFPCGFACSSYWVAKKSWNKAILPKPFARLEIVWMEAIGPISKELDPRSQDLSNELNLQMLDAERVAMSNLART